KDANIIYLSGPYGSVARFNRRSGLSQDVTPWPVSIFDSEINQRKSRAPSSPALVSSPTDSKALFLGTQYVMKTVPSLFRQVERLFMAPHVGIEMSEKQLTLGLPRIQIICSQKMPLGFRPIPVIEHRNFIKCNMGFRQFIIQFHSFDRGRFRLGHRVSGAGIA